MDSQIQVDTRTSADTMEADMITDTIHTRRIAGYGYEYYLDTVNSHEYEYKYTSIRIVSAKIFGQKRTRCKPCSM
eukprot:8649418-Pyramimonas_sp.AAC.1